MAYDHSRIPERVDGIPTGGIDPEGAAVRLGHSLSFFIGTAYGSTPTAERLARTVRAMHHTIKGTRPDGLAYDADDPEWLRWNYATVVWGLATAHERYHRRPLRDIDRYYREFVRVGESLGGTDLPATKAEVAECLESYLPRLALTPIKAFGTGPNLREQGQAVGAGRPVHGLGRPRHAPEVGAEALPLPAAEPARAARAPEHAVARPQRPARRHRPDPRVPRGRGAGGFGRLGTGRLDRAHHPGPRPDPGGSGSDCLTLRLLSGVVAVHSALGCHPIGGRMCERTRTPAGCWTGRSASR